MNYLLFGGQPDSGKTSAITRLTITLTSIPFAFSIVYGVFSPISGNDFLILIERINFGQSQFIIINSATDDKVCIDNLIEFIKKHNDKKIDLVISSVRDINWERTYFFSSLKINQTDLNVFEIPLARVTRRNTSGLFAPAINWYETTLDRLINFIITNPPFNL